MIYQSFLFENLEFVFHENMWWGAQKAINNQTFYSVREKKMSFECFDFASVLRTKWCKSTKIKLQYKLLTTCFYKKRISNFHKSQQFLFVNHINLIYEVFYENLEFAFRENMLWGAHKAIKTIKHSILRLVGA